MGQVRWVFAIVNAGPRDRAEQASEAVEVAQTGVPDEEKKLAPALCRPTISFPFLFWLL